MVQIKDLRPNQMAGTLKGHKVIVLKHLKGRTIIQLLSSDKKLDIPSW